MTDIQATQENNAQEKDLWPDDTVLINSKIKNKDLITRDELKNRKEHLQTANPELEDKLKKFRTNFKQAKNTLLNQYLQSDEKRFFKSPFVNEQQLERYMLQDEEQEDFFCFSEYMAENQDITAAWASCESKQPGISGLEAFQKLVYRSHYSDFKICGCCVVKWQEFPFNPDLDYTNFTKMTQQQREKEWRKKDVETDEKLSQSQRRNTGQSRTLSSLHQKKHGEDTYQSLQQEFLSEQIKKDVLYSKVTVQPYMLHLDDKPLFCKEFQEVYVKKQFNFSINLLEYDFVTYKGQYWIIAKTIEFCGERLTEDGPIMPITIGTIRIFNPVKNFRQEKVILVKTLKLDPEHENFENNGQLSLSQEIEYTQIQNLIYFFRRSYEPESGNSQQSLWCFDLIKNQTKESQHAIKFQEVVFKLNVRFVKTFGENYVVFSESGTTYSYTKTVFGNLTEACEFAKKSDEEEGTYSTVINFNKLAVAYVNKPTNWILSQIEREGFLFREQETTEPGIDFFDNVFIYLKRQEGWQDNTKLEEAKAEKKKAWELEQLAKKQAKNNGKSKFGEIKSNKWSDVVDKIQNQDQGDEYEPTFYADFEQNSKVFRLNNPDTCIIDIPVQTTAVPVMYAYTNVVNNDNYFYEEDDIPNLKMFRNSPYLRSDKSTSAKRKKRKPIEDVDYYTKTKLIRKTTFVIPYSYNKHVITVQDPKSNPQKAKDETQKTQEEGLQVQTFESDYFYDVSYFMNMHIMSLQIDNVTLPGQQSACSYTQFYRYNPNGGSGINSIDLIYPLFKESEKNKEEDDEKTDKKDKKNKKKKFSDQIKEIILNLKNENNSQAEMYVSFDSKTKHDFSFEQKDKFVDNMNQLVSDPLQKDQDDKVINPDYRYAVHLVDSITRCDVLISSDSDRNTLQIVSKNNINQYIESEDLQCYKYPQRVNTDFMQSLKHRNPRMSLRQSFIINNCKDWWYTCTLNSKYAFAMSQPDKLIDYSGDLTFENITSGKSERIVQEIIYFFIEHPEDSTYHELYIFSKDLQTKYENVKNSTWVKEIKMTNKNYLFVVQMNEMTVLFRKTISDVKEMIEKQRPLLESQSQIKLIKRVNSQHQEFVLEHMTCEECCQIKQRDIDSKYSRRILMFKGENVIDNADKDPLAAFFYCNKEQDEDEYTTQISNCSLVFYNIDKDQWYFHSFSINPKLLARYDPDQQSYINYVCLVKSYQSKKRVSDNQLQEQIESQTSVTNFQLALLFPQELGSLIEIYEYSFIENKKNVEQPTVRVVLSGLRRFFPSQKVQNDYKEGKLLNLYPLYSDNYQLEGTILQTKDNWNSKEHFTLFNRDLKANQFIIKTENSYLDVRKVFIFQEKHQDEQMYYLTCSAFFKPDFYMNEMLNAYELHYLLDQNLETAVNMILFDFKQLVFFGEQDDIKTMHYFKRYQILQGQTLFDLFLPQQEVIQDVFVNISKYTNNKLKSYMDELVETLKPEVKKEITEIGLYKDTVSILAPDLENQNVLEKCYSLKLAKQANMIIDYIFTQKEKRHYQSELMKTLLLILSQNQINSNIIEFFGNTNSDDPPESLCKFEMKIDHPDVPLYSNFEQNHLIVNELMQYMDVESEIVNRLKIRKNNQIMFGKNLTLIQTFPDKIAVEDKVKDEEKPADIIDQDDESSEEEEQEEGLNEKFDVYHYLIDFRMIILGKKLESLRSPKENKQQFKFDEFALSELIESLQSNPDIFNQPTIKRIIDVQFQKTFLRTQGLLFIYFFGFYIPFIASLYIDDVIAEKTVLFVSLVIQLIFLLNEFPQFYHYKFKYFTQFQDIIEIAQFIILYVYAGLRNSHDFQNDTSTAERVLSLILIVLGFFKVQFFIRIYENFGFLVQMVGQTITQVGPFVRFFLLWIFFFMICYYALNVEFGEEDEKYLTLWDVIKYFFMTYRDTVGDIQAPHYGLWMTKLEDEGSKVVILILIWTVWLANQIICLIILLNFLIAVISQVYDNVMATQQTLLYMHRAQLNKEYLLTRKLFANFPEFQVMIFSIDKDLVSKEDEKFQGFVQTVKNFVNSKQAQLTKRVDQFYENKQKSQEQSALESSLLVKQITETLSEVQDDQKKIKSLIDSHNSKFHSLHSQLTQES